MTDFKDRCRAWIDRHVPVHTRAEYLALLETNECLMLTLIAKCLDYEALVVEHEKLHNELWRTTPKPAFVGHYSADYDILRMVTHHRITWAIPPHRQNLEVADRCLLDRYRHEDTAQALRKHFMEKIAPMLWDATSLCAQRHTLRS